MADASDEIVGGCLALLHSQDFDRVSLIVGPQDQVIVGSLHIFHRASIVLEDGVHIEFALAVRLERVVVAVDQKRGSGEEAGIHAHAFTGVNLDEDKALPLLAVAFDFRFQFLEETLLEFKNIFHVHAGKEGMGGGDGPVGKENILKVVIAGGQDRSALIYLGGVKKVEYGEVLDG